MDLGFAGILSDLKALGAHRDVGEENRHHHHTQDHGSNLNNFKNKVRQHTQP